MDNQNRVFIEQALRPIQYRDMNGEVVTIDPRAILSFDKNNIHFERHANDYYLIARLTEITRLKYKDYEQKVNALHSNLYFKYLNDASLRAMNGNRKPSEAMIENAIGSDKQYQQANMQLNTLESRYREMQYLLKAVETKATMMVSAGAEQRSLNKTAPTNTVV